MNLSINTRSKSITRRCRSSRAVQKVQHIGELNFEKQKEASIHAVWVEAFAFADVRRFVVLGSTIGKAAQEVSVA